MSTHPPLLTVENLSKRFGSLQTLSNISFHLYPSEIVGLAGRNGAGKSTLVSILAGLQPADSGSVLLDGQRMLDNSGYQPLSAGVGVIHQQPELAEQLDVTTNIFLGQEINWRGLGSFFRFPSQRRMDERATELLTRLEAPFIPLREKAQNLSAEQRQLIAIARVLATPKRLILIDNPSLLLSIPYQQKLLQLTETWRRDGVAILFCSNNLDHLFAVSDRILVLRQGELVNSSPTDEITREEVVESLVGTDQRTQRTPAIWALDSYYLAREQAETLKHNQQLLERDLKARDQLNQQLVDQLAEQIRALDSANLALQDAQRRLLTEREEERKFLAREIHDQAIQDLLSLNYELEEIEERVAHGEVDIDDIVSVRGSIRRLVEDLRRICGNLRPPTIDNLGLDAALRSYTQEWSQRTGIAVNLEIYEGFGRLPEGIELSIFRMIQEGLNNIRKHANATEAYVSLRPTSPRLLLISISDNGEGMGPAVNLGNLSRSGHYGLLGISERTALLGGRLRFENQKSGGLLMQIEIPHPRVSRPVRD